MIILYENNGQFVTLMSLVRVFYCHFIVGVLVNHHTMCSNFSILVHYISKYGFRDEFILFISKINGNRNLEKVPQHITCPVCIVLLQLRENIEILSCQHYTATR